MSAELACDKCGHHYDQKYSLKIQYDGKDFNFDSFECAISHIGPKCHNCNTVIIGHGVEDNSNFFCSGHCAERFQ